MIGTLYINNVWFKTINVDKWHERIQYLLPSNTEPRYTRADQPIRLCEEVDNHMLYFIHVGYGFFHTQVTHDLFEVAFADKYETGH
jgi:hypothetical protein